MGAIGFHHTRLPVIVLIGGIIGGLGGFFMQYYLSVIDIHSTLGQTSQQLAFLHPITFEMTICVQPLRQFSACWP